MPAVFGWSCRQPEALTHTLRPCTITIPPPQSPPSPAVQLMALTTDPGYMAYYPPDGQVSVVRGKKSGVRWTQRRLPACLHGLLQVRHARPCCTRGVRPARPLSSAFTPAALAPPSRLCPQNISVLTGETSSVSIQQIVQLGMFSIITYAV